MEFQVGQRKTNPDFLTGVPEMLVLRLLSQRSMHGYAVVQAIKIQSQQQFQFGEGSIYPILHRLESNAMLKTKTITVKGRQRVVYSITAKGKKRLAESHSLWQQVVGAVNTIFEADDDDAKAMA